MLKTAGAGWAGQSCTAQHRIAAEDPYFRAALQNPLVLQESWCGCSIKGGKSVCVAEGQYRNLIKWWEQIIPLGALSLVAVTKLGHQLQDRMERIFYSEYLCYVALRTFLCHKT